MPSWGPRASSLVEPWRRFRAYGRLYPLWNAMYQEMPEIALDPASSSSRWTVRDLRHRLYRRVIEIRDGRLALSVYLTPGTLGDAADGVDDDEADAGAGPAGDRDAAGEAARLASALRAKRSGAQAGPRARRETQDRHAGGDLAAEIAWLMRVSREFRRVQAGSAAAAAMGSAGSAGSASSD
jgi:hypothetical protein